MSSTLMFLALIASIGQVQTLPPAAEPDRREQLKYFKERAAELALYRGKDAKTPLPLTPEPVLRYSNSEREIGSLDGATFLWLEGNRPVAAVSFSIRTMNLAAYRECTSLSETPLECRSASTAVWSPKTGGLAARPLVDAPAPAAGKPQRLAQMRTLARRFSATCYHPRTGAPTELRLMPQPLYRYADEKGGIIDGGLFAFVVSNDPELFLILEAVAGKKEGDSRWQYSLARMSSHKETVRLDDKEVWTVLNYYQDPSEDKKTGPYVEGRVGTFVSEAAAPKEN